MDVKILGMTISLAKVINSVFYVLFVLMFYLIVRRLLKVVFTRASGRHMSSQQLNRVQTIHEMLMSVAKYVTLILVFLVILANLGVNVTSLLAGLGVLTAVLGLAFQDMLKDVIAGITIITEGQFSVGDLVSVDGFKGTVLNMGLKTTQIKNYKGEVKIVSNRNIGNLINYSKFDSLVEISMVAPYEEDSERILGVLAQVTRKLDGKISSVTSEMVINPVNGMDNVGVQYQITCTCEPEAYDDVRRIINREVLDEFRRQKIAIAYPKTIIMEKK